MFDLFRLWCDWWLAGLLLVLLIGPVGFYLTGAWRERREEIASALTDSAAALYFATFRNLHENGPSFPLYYSRRFGRRRYAVPLTFLVAVAGTEVVWAVASLLVWTGLRPPTAGLLEATPVAALAGAYVWVVADLLARCRFRDLLPIDLWWSCWRLVVAVPMALAVGQAFAPALGAPIAFLLGAFPTRSLTTIARRFARRSLNLGADSDVEAESELEKLQGVDTRIAERFADEGITTILQLAYADPVELTMRCASFSFSFVVDVTSQALAWLYLGDALVRLRVGSLRGAQEIATLMAESDGEDLGAAARAKAVVGYAAGALGVDAVALERTLREIAGDPYTQFLCQVWETGEDEEDAAQGDEEPLPAVGG